MVPLLVVVWLFQKRVKAPKSVRINSKDSEEVVSGLPYLPLVIPSDLKLKWLIRSEITWKT